MELPRKRLLDSSKAQPKAVLGKTLCLPDLKRYFALVHERNGWGIEQTDETQAEAGFRFNGASLAVYSRKVLGRGLKKVHVPLAYTGIVAKALGEAGHDVLNVRFWLQHERNTFSPNFVRYKANAGGESQVHIRRYTVVE